MVFVWFPRRHIIEYIGCGKWDECSHAGDNSTLFVVRGAGAVAAATWGARRPPAGAPTAEEGG